MRHFLIALFLVGACAAPESIEPPQEASREDLKLLIAGFEEGPSRERLDILNLDTVSELISIASNPKEKRFYRARAFTALGLYPEDRVFDFFQKSLSSPEDLGTFLLPSAIYATGKAFGESRPEEVAKLISPALKHDSPAVRESAVKTLALTPTPLARAALEEAARVEIEPGVKLAIEQALLVP